MLVLVHLLVGEGVLGRRRSGTCETSKSRDLSSQLRLLPRGRASVHGRTSALRLTPDPPASRWADAGEAVGECRLAAAF